MLAKPHLAAHICSDLIGECPSQRGGGGGGSAGLFDMLKVGCSNPRLTISQGLHITPGVFQVSVQLKTTVDHRACLFFQSLPNPPHQCQHCESYEVSRSLRDKFPAKITNKQPKRRVKNHSSLRRVQRKTSYFLRKQQTYSFGLCVYYALNN